MLCCVMCEKKKKKKNVDNKKENVQDGWERGTDDLCSSVHCPLFKKHIFNVYFNYVK